MLFKSLGTALSLLAYKGDLGINNGVPQSVYALDKDGLEPIKGVDGKQMAVRINCLDGVDPGELVDVPVKYFNMAHDDFKTPPAETRHL